MKVAVVRSVFLIIFHCAMNFLHTFWITKSFWSLDTVRPWLIRVVYITDIVTKLNEKVLSLQLKDVNIASAGDRFLSCHAKCSFGSCF